MDDDDYTLDWDRLNAHLDALGYPNKDLSKLGKEDFRRIQLLWGSEPSYFPELVDEFIRDYPKKES